MVINVIKKKPSGINTAAIEPVAISAFIVDLTTTVFCASEMFCQQMFMRLPSCE